MVREVRLPIEAPEGVLFTLKDITYSPERPKMKEPFTVKGKVELFKIPFVAPVWVIVTVEYPEALWEEIIPIVGAPQVREMATAIGGNFEVKFAEGFEREGEFKLTTRLYAGPTVPIDKVTLPPFPPAASEETTFMVAGEVPPEEVIGFRNLEIVSYSKNGGPPVTAGEVLELEVGDKCRVNVSYEHKGDAVTKVLYSSIGDVKPVLGFDEIISNKKSLSVAKSEDWQRFEAYIDIPITTAISPGDYDLYAKLDTVISPFVENVIRIVGVPVKGEVRNVEIIGYDTPLRVGDTCWVRVSFEYLGPATSKRLYSAIGNAGVWGFDEIITGSKTISIPETPSWQSYEADVTITVTTAISPGAYDVYAKVDTVLSPFYENVITITEVVPPAPPVPEAQFANLEVVGYDTPLRVGDTCQVKVRFAYQGPVVGKTLRCAIGNAGIWGFDEIVYGSKSISVPQTLSWTTYEQSVGIFISTAISPGVYDVYTKIDGISPLISPFYENVIEITAVAPPPPPAYTLTIAITPTGAGRATKSPDKATYSAGELVALTAYPNPGYEFDYWAGVPELPTTETTYITMDRDYSVMAVFRKIVVGKGTFYVYVVNAPIDFVDWAAGWIANATEYVSSWVVPLQATQIKGPYGEDVPLKGRIKAYLWTGTETKEYGPTREYSVKDGGVYDFDVRNLTLTEVAPPSYM